MSASVSLAGALPAAIGSHRRTRCSSSLLFSPDGAHKAPASSSAATATPKGESISGVGFGSGRSGGGGGKGSRKSTVVRRTPVQNLLIQSAATATATEKDDAGALPEQEKAFLLVWPGLGLLILVEGIVLAASGFFPEEWDNLFAKYLYPSFTPTVVLFLGGTVAYGVFKYLKTGQSKS